MRSILVALCAVGCIFSATAPAQAQVQAQAPQWNPTRPIRVVVPYPPGGASDVAARSLSERVGQKLGQPILVENRPGAGGILGTDTVFRAEPDGYTLLLGASDAISIAPNLQPELTRYRSADFVPVAPVNLVNTVLVTRADLGVKTAADLVALAKKSRLTYSSWGNGSLGQVSAEAFKSTTGVDLTNVPYQGAAPAAQAVLAGQVDVMLMPGPLWLSFRERVVTIGTTSAGPFQGLPTLTSQGVPVVVEIWQGILAPPKTPRPVVDRLARAFSETLDEPEMKERSMRLGSIPLSLDQPAFAAMVSADMAKWKKMLADYRIKPE